MARESSRRRVRQGAALYNSAIVFDANLNPPFQDKFPFPKAMLDMVRQSGITAIKTSLGGFNENFNDTVDEISFFQRVFEEYPDIYMQVRRHADFADAKRTKRMGVILSFEAITMHEGKIDHIELFRGLGVRVMQLTYNIASPFGTGVLGDPAGWVDRLGAQGGRENEYARRGHRHQPFEREDVVRCARGIGNVADHHPCGLRLRPSSSRNKSDALLRAVAQKGGVIGIFDLPYLTASPKQPTLDDYMAHMTHALNVSGEDHVGVGSDSALAAWDTSPAALAAFKKDEADRRKAGVAAPGEDDRPLYVVGLNTPRRSEVIADALLARGYKEGAVEKVLGLNFTNALGRIWKD